MMRAGFIPTSIPDARMAAITVDDAYAHCLRVAKQSRSSFLPAMRLLPQEKRRSLLAVYAFSRACDDVADEEGLSPEERLRRFADLRQLLHDAYSARAESPVGVALADTVRRYNIPKEHFAQLILGCEGDGTVTRYATFSDLRTYCYRVASTVGLIGLEIFGYEDPVARELGEDLGIGMQLVNILRDVKEDAARGRIYLPQQELREHGVPEEDVLRGRMSDAFRRVLALQADRAREFLDRGGRVVPLVVEDARRCPALLRASYRTLLDRIGEAGYDVYRRRIRLGMPAKLRLLFKAWTGRL
jgi:phytoene synthase